MIEWAELLCTHLKMSCDLNGQLGLATPPHSPQVMHLCVHCGFIFMTFVFQIRSKTLPVPSLQPPPPGFPVPPVPGGSPHTSPRYSNLSTSPIPSSPLLSNPQRPLPRLPFEEVYMHTLTLASFIAKCLRCSSSPLLLCQCADTLQSTLHRCHPTLR